MSSVDSQADVAPNSLPVRFKAMVAVALLAAVMLTHGRSISGDFLFDDNGAITSNTSIHSLSSIGTVIRGNGYTTVAGRPALNLSFAVNYAFGELRPTGYHLFNYGVHAAAAFLLFCLLRRLLAAFDQTRTAAVYLAAAISLLWCVHPLTINGVSYICQRAESMASLCYLAVLWGFVKGVQTSQRRWFVVSLVAAWLGSLTKEIIATAPLAVVVLDVLVVTRDWRQSVRRHCGVFLGLSTSWIALGICMFLSRSRDGTIGYGMEVSLREHVQTQIWALARYLRMLVWPDPLIFDYGVFIQNDSRQLLLSAAMLLTFGAGLLWLTIRRSSLAVPGIVLCFLLAPTSVVPIVTQTVAEHRMYLASACGITGIVVVLFLAIKELRLLSLATPAAMRLAMGVLLVPLGLMLSLQTVRDTQLLCVPESIWADTMQKLPTNQRAYWVLALLKSKASDGRPDALRLCDEGIALQGPFTRHLYSVRGTVHRDLREFENAFDDFSRAIDLKPDVIDDRYYRAAVLRELGRFDEALRDLDQARSIDPDNVTTDFLLGTVLVARGELDLALERFDRVLEREPTRTDARRRRAAVYAQLGRWQDAMSDIRHLQQEGRPVDDKLVRDVQKQLASWQTEAK